MKKLYNVSVSIEAKLTRIWELNQMVEDDLDVALMKTDLGNYSTVDFTVDIIDTDEGISVNGNVNVYDIPAESRDEAEVMVYQLLKKAGINIGPGGLLVIEKSEDNKDE